MSHFSPGDLIMIYIGSPEDMPYIVYKVEMISSTTNKHTSNYDIIYYKPDGTLGRVDMVHVFHVQECDSSNCKNFFEWYINKK